MKKIFLTMALAIGLMGNAQVKIGANPTTINDASLLELESSTQGVNFPKLALTSTAVAAPLAGGVHVAGMTVYNTATTTNAGGTNDVIPGLYANDGSQWVKLGTPISAVKVKIRTLDISNSGSVSFDLSNNTVLLSTDHVLILSKSTGQSITMPDPSGVNNGRELVLINNSVAAGGSGTYAFIGTFIPIPNTSLPAVRAQTYISNGTAWYKSAY